MEAMVVGYPPEDKGKISVTATKEEWREIMEAIWDYPDDPSMIDQFYETLKSQGVFK